MVDAPEPTAIEQIITYGGMAVGTVIAAVLMRLGLKKGPVRETEVAITGATQITDMAPVRELLGQLNVLTLELQQSVSAQSSTAGALIELTQGLSRLSDLVAAALQQREEERENKERQDEIARQVEERWEQLLKDHPELVARPTSSTRPKP